MRQILCNSMAYELMLKVKEVGIEKSQDWFMERSKAENMTNSEIFYVALLSGGIGDHMVEPLPKPKAEIPWLKRDIVVFDEAHHPVTAGEFTNLKQRGEQKQRKGEYINPKQPKSKAPQGAKPAPSSKCLKDARMAMGAAPYNEPGNYLVGDGYFSQSCVGKYGQRMWDTACEMVRKEMGK